MKQNYNLSGESKVLGCGAFGKVYLAQNNQKTDFEVAIKQMSKSKIVEIDKVRAEAEILATLDHPNIVNYYETYEDNLNLYFVMEYI